MAVQIGPKIGIEGEKAYRDAINQIIAQANTLSSEMKVVATSFDKTTTAEEKSAKKSDVLTKQIKNQEDLVSKLNEQLAQSVKKYGENDAKTLKWKTAVNNAQSELNNLNRQLEENNSNLKKTGDEMKKAENNALSFGDVLKANLLSDAIKAGFSALVSAVEGLGNAFKGAVTESAKFADEMLSLSAKTGISTKSLQEYQYMAELIDTDVSTITSSMKKLTSTMSSAQKGTKSATDAFAKLGVSFTDSTGALRDNEEVFGEVLDALGGISNETERDALAMSIFGKSAQELNPLIATGAENLQAFREEAQQAGYVLSDEQLGKLGAVDDAYQRWNNTLDTVKRQIAVGVAPALEKFLETVKDMVAKIDWEKVGQSLGGLFDKLVDTLATIDLSSVIDTIVESIVSFIDTIAQIDFGALFKGVSDVMNFIQKYGGVVAGAIAGIVAVVTALQIISLATAPAVTTLCATLAPFIAPIAGVVAGIVALIAIIKNWGAISEWLKQTWENVKQKVVDTFNNLKEKALGIWEDIKKGISDKVSKVWESITGVFDDIKKKVTGVASDALQWGKDIVGGIADGIRSAISWLTKPLSDVANKIKSWLHFSHPDVGPLKDYDEWMPDFMKGLAQGIESNVYRIGDAMSDVTDAMVLNPSADYTVTSNPGSYKQVSPSFAITINGGNASADEIADAVMDKIQLEYERTAYAWQ